MASTVEDFRLHARSWLDAHCELRGTGAAEDREDDSVAIFYSLDPEDEAQLVERLREWIGIKASAGYHRHAVFESDVFRLCVPFASVGARRIGLL